MSTNSMFCGENYKRYLDVPSYLGFWQIAGHTLSVIKMHIYASLRVNMSSGFLFSDGATLVQIQ